jgi:hypothetical protein
VETLEELKKRTLVYVPDASGYWSEPREQVYHWRAGSPHHTLCGLEVYAFDLVPLAETTREVCIDCDEVTKRIEKGWSS